MYSYETFPGQTVVRTSDAGFGQDELLAELSVNGDGFITNDDERSDSFCRTLEGLTCEEIDHWQFSDHGAGRKSVQIFGADSKLLRDANL